MPNSTEELKAKPVSLYQFIDHKTGKRSEPFTGNMETVQKILDARQEGEAPLPEDYILLVAVMDGKDTNIPATPLITVKSFEEYYYNPNNQAQEA